jgi:hypothetical protein
MSPQILIWGCSNPLIHFSKMQLMTSINATFDSAEEIKGHMEFLLFALQKGNTFQLDSNKCFGFFPPRWRWQCVRELCFPLVFKDELSTWTLHRANAGKLPGVTSSPIHLESSGDLQANPVQSRSQHWASESPGLAIQVPLSQDIPCPGP